jgi:hypothetical protein
MSRNYTTPKCSIPSRGGCPNNVCRDHLTCISRKGFHPISDISNRKSPVKENGLFSLYEPLHLYDPKHLEGWLQLRKVQNTVRQNVEPLIDSVREEWKKDEDQDKIWRENTDNYICYLDNIPKECLYKILSHSDICNILNSDICSRHLSTTIFLFYSNYFYRSCR